MGFSAGSGAWGEGTGLVRGTVSAPGSAEAVEADPAREAAGGPETAFLPGSLGMLMVQGLRSQKTPGHIGDVTQGRAWTSPTGAQMTEA